MNCNYNNNIVPSWAEKTPSQKLLKDMELLQEQKDQKFIELMRNAINAIDSRRK
jgi:hypothetical protein